MKKFGILGYPLGHTLSPQIHTRLFELCGHNEEYKIYEVPSSALDDFASGFRSFAAINVTIPHKVEVMRFLDELDESAQRCSAVNLITVKNGRLCGYNTDCYGFAKTAAELGAGLDKSVCVLGAGGVGRMFAEEAALNGGAVTLAVRAEGLADAEQVKRGICEQNRKANVRIVEISRLQTLDEDFNLLINATPVGMYPHTAASPVSTAFLPHCRFVFDAVYNPTETTLLREAKAAGCTVTGGIAMLVWQAVRAHEIYDGSRYKTEDIKELIKDMTELLAKKQTEA
ncbi:MAG: shikimate dehydrogenase [Hydrogenoanaerobacterium sp.]